jgi:hypothetical protein
MAELHTVASDAFREFYAAFRKIKNRVLQSRKITLKENKTIFFLFHDRVPECHPWTSYVIPGQCC